MSKGSGGTRGSNSGNTHTSSMNSKKSAIGNDINSHADSLGANKISGKLAGDVNKHIDRAINDLKEIAKNPLNTVKDVNDCASNFDKAVGKHYYNLGDIAGVMEANARDAKGARKTMFEKAAQALRDAAYDLKFKSPDLGTRLGEIEGVLMKQGKWK